LTGNPIYLRACSGCDWLTEDAYSSMAPDPTFAFVGGSMLPYTQFCICFLNYDYALHKVNFANFVCYQFKDLGINRKVLQHEEYTYKSESITYYGADDMSIIKVFFCNRETDEQTKNYVLKPFFAGALKEIYTSIHICHSPCPGEYIGIVYILPPHTGLSSNHKLLLGFCPCQSRSKGQISISQIIKISCI
jgi:hypothetical protein